MTVELREYEEKDLEQMTELWNQTVAEGNSFPQEFPLTIEEAKRFFSEQSQTGIAEEAGEVVGLYILHPNNIGRCGHIGNASYAVKQNQRGKRIGEKLVKESMAVAKQLSFKILQFNAVVATNKGAIHLYEKLGFTALGTIPKGFKLAEGTYADIIPFYITLAE